MAFYETTFIIRQDFSQQDALKLADSFANIVKDNGGEIIKVESWGLRNLAYIINKNRKGHYFMLGLNAGNEAIKELQRKISLNENVLRQLTIKVEALTKEPSLMMEGVAADA